MGIRAAVAAGVNITFKILYNDAVAMTGGQSVDGPLSVPQITREVLAEGARRVVVVTDEPDKYLCAPASSASPSATATSSTRSSASCASSRAPRCWSTTRPARPRSGAGASVA